EAPPEPCEHVALSFDSSRAAARAEPRPTTPESASLPEAVIHGMLGEWTQSLSDCHTGSRLFSWNQSRSLKPARSQNAPRPSGEMNVSSQDIFLGMRLCRAFS